MSLIFTDHCSGSGTEIAPVCVCVSVCVYRQKFSNEMSFELDNQQGGLSDII